MEKRSDNILSEKLDKLINESLKKRVFSACSVGFFVKNKDSIDRNIFHYGLAGEGQKNMVDGNTFFDLASLTKPIVTSLCVLALIQEGKLGLEDKAAKFFERDVSPLQQQCTLFHLLTHSSGFPAHKPYYKKLVQFPQEERMEKVTEWIFSENLLFPPGSDTLYSDLGFILLGRIVEKVSGESLDNIGSER